MSGTIKINQQAEATANLNFATEDGQRGQLNLSWQAFERDRVATIEGVVNDRQISLKTLII